MADTPDLLRDKVNEFIQVLQRTTAFKGADSARSLCHHLVANGKLSALRDFTSSYDKNKSDIYEDVRNNHKEVKDGGDALAASSLAMALSSQPEDEYGFVKSANRSKAEPLVQPSLMNLVPFLIEAHIDSALNDVALPQLRTLAKNPKFKQLYREIITTEAVQFSIEEDSSKPFGGGNYRSNILFVYEFFRTGNTPYLVGSVPNADGAGGTFAGVVKAWLDQINAPSEEVTFSVVFNKVLAAQTSTQAESEVKDWPKFTQHLMQILLPVDLVYLPGLDMTSGLPMIVENVLSSVVPQAMSNEAIKTKILTSIPQNTLGFAQELWTDWKKEIDVLAQAALSSIGQDTIGEEHIGDVWRGGDPPTTDRHKVRDHEYGVALATAQLECRDADVWNWSSRLFKTPLLRPAEDTKWTHDGHVQEKKTAGVRFWQEDLEPVKPTCFAAGTLVLTNHGPLPIEILRENDKVLTRADTNEWGIVSSEIVRTPVRGGQIILCSINGGPAFFTPNHPFVDKFGRIRAMDPTAAHEENPWLEVGELKVGHVLLHTEDGKSYTEVPIQSLKRETVNCDFVHGVHLREGLRSYHANGYLVRMNYPEITIKTIADALRQIPPAEQLRMLHHLEELQPLLSRFGQGTVMGLLNAELGRSDSELAAMRTKPSSGPKVPALYFQSRSFRLTANSRDLENLGDHGILPDVDCLDGQIWLDGTACACAQVLERGFVWSRPLDGDLWEHGLCSFGGDHSMAAGDGFIWVDNDPSPRQPSSKAIQFQALAIALRVPAEDVEADGELSFRAAHSEAAAEEVYEVGKEESDDNETSVEETGFAAVNGVISDASILAERVKAIEKVDGPKPTAASYTIEEVVETYDLTCEVDTLQEGPTGEPPFKVLQVQKVRKQAGGGVPIFDFALPALDRLAVKLNEKAPPGSKIAKLYSTFVTRTEKNEPCCEITMISPERLATAADDNVLEGIDDHGVKSYTDLKYTSMGLDDGDLDMRFIPQKIVLTTNTLKGLIGGTWIEFDPKSIGDAGLSHKVYGKKLETPKLPVSPLEQGAPAGPTVGQKPQFLPIQVKTRSVRDLTTGFTINTVALKKDTQELLKKVMHYHMDADDRQFILGVKERPTPTTKATYNIDEIPEDLAGLMATELQEWIKGTYAPAWVAQCAAGLTEEQQTRFKLRVDVPQQRRLKYFWQGSGKHCLGKSRQYNELNTQLSILAFRCKYPRIVDYLSDKTMATDEDTNNDAIKQMSGGKKWAHLLFEELMKENMVGHIAKESALSEITQLNTLEMYCTMLNALWKDDTGTKDLGPLTLQLSNAVKARLLQENLFKHRAINDPKQLENGLRDYLLDFFTLILDEEAATKAGISNEFREAMVKSLIDFNQWKEDYQKREIRKNAEATVDKASAMIKSAAAMASGAMEGLSDIPGALHSGRKGLANVWSAARRAVKRQKGDYSSQQGEPTQIEAKPWTGAFMFALGLGMTAWYVWESWDAWGSWLKDPNSLTKVQKARLVIGSFQAFGNLAFTTYKAYETFKGKGVKTAQKVIESNAVIARNLEMSVMEISMATHPDIILETTDLANRTRRNAISSKDMALGTNRSRNVQAALAGEAGAAPEKVLDRADSMSKSGKAGKKSEQAFKTKSKFSTTEYAIRGFACAMSLAMLIIACIAAAQAWEEMGLVERIQTVLTLVIQACQLIVDILILVCAVPGWVGLAIAAIGWLLSLIVTWIWGRPEPPPERLTKWWTANQPGAAGGFFERLPAEPKCLLDYTLNTTSATVGKDATLVITGNFADRGVDSQFDRLTAINVYFSSSTVNGTSVLFDAKAQRLEALLSKSSDPAPGQCSMAIPASLTTVYKAKPEDAGRPVYPAQIGEIGTSPTTFRYDLGIEVDNTARTETDPLPAITFNKGEQIVFKLRGVIAAHALPDASDKTDYSKSTPPWKKYTIQVVESYADAKDELQGTSEVELTIEKAL
ncbi:hypothetical protein DE146DRAFT_731458 [Phaeosphaeria sp. MPI-PUGE-AT-0046c]|nr:hypothetical protein DE146DRAFT_731458 [Phaeosphaeria sp. MPI-PUGE-AT-0046c]